MSNGSPNIIQVIFRNIFGNGNSSAITSRPNEVILKLVKIDVLEMEDVLFHLNSAVMMPENPQGKSSTQGGGAGEEQLAVTGLKALALVYKQFEFDPNKRIVISAHTDTSGTPEFNFKLSDERAKGILHLLTKNQSDENFSKNEWAKICYGRHKIEDYQQIMKHFEKKLACGCDPGKIDDAWGDKTKTATLNFFKKTNPGKAVALFTQVENDAKKRWPIDAWSPVYDLYSHEIAEALEITTAELDILRQSAIHFITDNKPFVGCGESFPIDQKYKDNYRSQKNRRVEILFFDKDEVPINKYGQPDIKCPADTKKVHKAEDCPFWRKFYFVPLYIDPKDLKSIVYHLQFVYFDKIKKKQLPVPLGLKINAYEDGHKKIPTETVFKKGVYYVKVQFDKKIKDPARTEFYFEFESEDLWVFTKDDKTDPVVIIKKKADVDVLSFTDKQKYYDLPKSWSSRNYWTRYDGDIKKGERFEKVFKDIQKLKPLGDTTTKPDKPLVFSLDDIVLVDSRGNQNITDKDDTDAAQNLSENSRITILYLDKDDNHKVKIFKPKGDAQYHSDLPFKENVISEYHDYSRTVVFCSNFYHIAGKRTEKSVGFDFAKKNILGARAAILEDADVSFKKSFIGTSGSSDITDNYVAADCGNFDLHYLHECDFADKKIISALILYWSCRFKINAAKGGIAQDRVNFETKGLNNAMNRHSMKDYQIEKLNGTKDILIKTFELFEAKQDIASGATSIKRGGKHKCMVNLQSDANGSDMSITVANFRHSGYADENKPFGSAPGDPDDPLNNTPDYDGSKTKRLTVAHELGHASGWDDEYVSSLSGFFPVPKYSQYYPGMPYSVDELALMTGNHATRMRHFWGRVNWLNDFSKAGKSLHKFLDGNEFKITHKDLNFSLIPAKYRNIYKPAFDSINHVFDTHSKNDLLLYKLGNDEFAHLLTSGQIYKGLLVIRSNISAVFQNGTSNWTNAQKRQWLQRLDADLRRMLDKKYRLTSADSKNDFSNIYLKFMPHAEVVAGASGATTHFRIEITKDDSANFTTTGNTIKIGNNCNNKKIIRFFFGKDATSANLTTADLNEIKSWVESNKAANGSFSFHNL